MGDPTILTYYGIPSDLSIDHPDAIPIGMNILSISSESHTYVAVNQNGILLDAGYTNNNGEISLSIDQLDGMEPLEIVASKQNKKVYNSNIFLGSELQDTYNVVSAIIGPLTPKKNSDFNSILIQDYYWPVYLAYYKPTLELDQPEYTVSAKLQENGIILEYIIDYGEFSIISSLKKISSVNKNTC